MMVWLASQDGPTAVQLLQQDDISDLHRANHMRACARNAPEIRNEHPAPDNTSYQGGNTLDDARGVVFAREPLLDMSTSRMQKQRFMSSCCKSTRIPLVGVLMKTLSVFEQAAPPGLPGG